MTESMMITDVLGMRSPEDARILNTVYRDGTLGSGLRCYCSDCATSRPISSRDGRRAEDGKGVVMPFWGGVWER